MLPNQEHADGVLRRMCIYLYNKKKKKGSIKKNEVGGREVVVMTYGGVHTDPSRDPTFLASCLLNNAAKPSTSSVASDASFGNLSTSHIRSCLASASLL